MSYVTYVEILSGEFKGNKGYIFERDDKTMIKVWVDDHDFDIEEKYTAYRHIVPKVKHA